jgi:hypothetical protein
MWEVSRSPTNANVAQRGLINQRFQSAWRLDVAWRLLSFPTDRPVLAKSQYAIKRGESVMLISSAEVDRICAHTPGGSSSGSGAAVGDFQVPLAFGTQTAGSLIRPASFNGIYGLKPSWGVVSREGVTQFSTLLDTVGWYGRSVDDLALVASAFQLPGLSDVGAPSPSALRVAYCETPYWERTEPASRIAMETAAKRFSEAGAKVQRLRLPEAFAGLADAQATVMYGEGGPHFCRSI